jgi:polar amino acid transport system substrate-binding protein
MVIRRPSALTKIEESTMMQKLRLFFATILLAASQQAFSQEPLPEGSLLEPGKLMMAADFAAAPNQFINPDGTMDGLNYDLCGALAGRMGLEIDWTNLAFPGLVPGLQAKRFDGLCTAIFINPDRLAIMNMVPYVQWGEGLMVSKGSELGGGCDFVSGDNDSYSACFDTLAGRQVAVAAAGTTNTHLQEQNERMKAAGLEPMELLAFDTNADTIQALVSGQAEAAYLNDPQGAFFISRTNPAFEMIFTGYSPNQLAIAVLKENSALADAIVTGLEALKEEGTYAEILDKWGVAAVSSFDYAK